MPAELLTHWTIRLALALYVAFVAGRLAVPDRPWWRRIERPVWTLACLSFLCHLAAAMHYYHGWSNAAAVLDTAEQTERLLGYRFGEGIYFSYAFAALWAMDVAWWWIRPDSYLHRNRLLSIVIHAYLLFIVFNGAIVFETGPTRWLGIPAAIGLAALFAWRLLSQKSRHPASPTQPTHSTDHHS